MSVIMPSLQGFKKNADGSYSVTEKRAEYGKVTGTQMSGILNMNPWQTPFSTSVRMMRLFNEDISDKPSVHAGTVIEPKILDYIGAVHGDEVFEKREGDHESWASDFQDDVFGGHVDGFMPDGSIVEIKTSSRPQDWNKQIPIHYHIQASLYAEFFKADRIIFAVGFTDKDTLSNPDGFVPDKNNTIVVETGKIEGFDKMLKDAEEFYRRFILNGVTPIPDATNPIDRQIMSYLDAQLWTEEDAKTEMQLMNAYQDSLDNVKNFQTMLDDSKQRFGLYMDYNDIGEISDGSTTIKRAVYSRTAIDTNLLKKDGLYDLYAKEKEYKTVKISRK